MNIACAAVSVFGNGIVVFVVLSAKHLRNPSNWLLVALASTDLFAGAIAQPLYGIYFGFFSSSNSCLVEKASTFIAATSCSTSMLLLCLIARDRYLHISKGLEYNRYASGFKIAFQIVGCWLIGLITGGTFMVDGSGFQKYLGFATFSSVQIFSFIYISVMYFLIKRFLQNHFKRIRDEKDTQRGSPTLGAKIATERSYNTTMIMIVLLFVIVWFPFMVILIIGTAHQIKKEIPGTWLQNGFMWTAILTYVNGAINPFIYGIRYVEVGREMKKKIRRIFCLKGKSTV